MLAMRTMRPMVLKGNSPRSHMPWIPVEAERLRRGPSAGPLVPVGLGSSSGGSGLGEGSPLLLELVVVDGGGGLVRVVRVVVRLLRVVMLRVVRVTVVMTTASAVG